MSEIQEVFDRIDARLADLREANETYRKASWDRSDSIQRNDREIRWLLDTRSILVLSSAPPVEFKSEVGG